MATHSREQGLRVHHLTNLGGLVAIAGLDRSHRISCLERCSRLPATSRIRASNCAGKLQLSATRNSMNAALKSAHSIRGCARKTCTT